MCSQQQKPTWLYTVPQHRQLTPRHLTVNCTHTAMYSWAPHSELHIHSNVTITLYARPVVLLRIPNPQPNPRILPESVRVRIRESFAAVSDGFGSSVCMSYLLIRWRRSSDVCAAVWEIKRMRHRRRRRSASYPSLLSGRSRHASRSFK